MDEPAVAQNIAGADGKACIAIIVNKYGGLIFLFYSMKK